MGAELVLALAATGHGAMQPKCCNAALPTMVPSLVFSLTDTFFALKKKNFIKAPWQYRKCQSEMHCRQIEISLSLNLLLLTDVLPCLLRASNLEYLSAW